MSKIDTAGPVPCWEEQINLPTYPVQPADPNPMFFEKRVYQGSSGKLALAQYGLGNTVNAANSLELVLAEDPNHLAAREIARWIESRDLLEHSGTVGSTP